MGGPPVEAMMKVKYKTGVIVSTPVKVFTHSVLCSCNSWHKNLSDSSILFKIDT